MKGLGLSPKNSKTVAGYSVFGNPALPVPENPKAEHPIQKSNFQTEKVNCV